MSNPQDLLPQVRDLIAKWRKEAKRDSLERSRMIHSRNLATSSDARHVLDLCADELSTLLTEAETPDPSGWQEIATAPKDGSFMLLWCAEVSECALVGYQQQSGRWEFAHCDSQPFQPTHYMPLPAPPQDQETRQ